MTIPKQLLEAKIMKAEANYDWLKDEVHCLYEENKNLKEDFKKHIDRINELTNRIDKAIKSLNYYIEGMNESLEIWNIVKENEKIEVDMVFQMLEREKQNYIDILDILKGSDKE